MTMKHKAPAPGARTKERWRGRRGAYGTPSRARNAEWVSAAGRRPLFSSHPGFTKKREATTVTDYAAALPKRRSIFAATTRVEQVRRTTHESAPAEQERRHDAGDLRIHREPVSTHGPAPRPAPTRTAVGRYSATPLSCSAKDPVCRPHAPTTR